MLTCVDGVLTNVDSDRSLFSPVSRSCYTPPRRMCLRRRRRSCKPDQSCKGPVILECSVTDSSDDRSSIQVGSSNCSVSDQCRGGFEPFFN